MVSKEQTIYQLLPLAGNLVCWVMTVAGSGSYPVAERPDCGSWD